MGLRSAINDKCRDCIADPAAPGTWREQVAQCSSIRCPLWPYRPEPTSGPFVGCPRDPETVSREWLRKPIGEAISRYPLGELTKAVSIQGSALRRRKGPIWGCRDASR